MEWTATARELIARKEYRFLSPSFMHNRSGHIMRLNGAGLVHRPALHLTALASQETPMLDPKKKPAPETSLRSPLIERLMKVLNLSPEATEEELPDSLEAWLAEKEAKPDPKKFVPVEAVAQMLQDRQPERATMAESQAVEKVGTAIRAGYFPPALRDWAIALCRADEASFDTFMSKTSPVFARMSKALIGDLPPGIQRPGTLSEAEQAVCSQLGLKPEQLAAFG